MEVPEVSWPPEYIELKRIDEMLKCGICYEHIKTTVMTPCSHNYCSVCIRKYLHYKTQCPACFQTTFEPDLHPNRIMDEVIAQFIKVRVKICNRISRDTDKNYIASETKSHPVAPAAAPKTPTSVQKITPQKLQLFSPSSSSKSSNSVQETVCCPVCTVDIAQIHINKHLDECLKRDSNRTVVKRVEKKRKPLPKLVFNLMKDAELRRKMKEHGLPTHGDRKTLETRFQRFCVIYNAECDKLEPRSVAELLKQCLDEETIEKRMQKPISWLRVSRTSEQKVIDDVNKKYLEMNADNFNSLITSMKTRKASQKPDSETANKTTVSSEPPSPITLDENSSVSDIFNLSTDESDAESTAKSQYEKDCVIESTKSVSPLIRRENIDHGDDKPCLTRKRTRPSPSNT